MNLIVLMRRLEIALATLAAIRAELEKEKQRKLEEQQRLDEEGAANCRSRSTGRRFS